MNDLQRSRLVQAKESLDEAQALLAEGIDTVFVLNSLYFAFYYPVIALVHEGRVPDAMQSVTIGLFEQRFVGTGTLSPDFLDAIRRMFELKPKCGERRRPAGRDEIEHLSGQAASFIAAVSVLAAGKR